MKKLMLTAAFTIVGAVAVSAQTSTPKPAENSKPQTTTQTQPANPQKVEPASSPQNQKTTETTTVDTSTATDSVARANVDATMEKKPRETAKEDRKRKGKSK